MGIIGVAFFALSTLDIKGAVDIFELSTVGIKGAVELFQLIPHDYPHCKFKEQLTSLNFPHGREPIFKDKLISLNFPH